MNNLEEFWSDDFAPLQFAGKEILQALREDEQAPDADLYRKISSGAHAYVTNNDDRKFPSMKLKHRRSLPIPALPRQEAQKAKAHTFMGLLSEAAMAWMSVDHQLFLWSVYSTEKVIHFENPRKQPIITVGLVRPKQGKQGTTRMCVAGGRIRVWSTPARTSRFRSLYSSRFANGKCKLHIRLTRVVSH